MMSWEEHHRRHRVLDGVPTDADAAVDDALASEQPELSALLTAYADRPAVVTARAVARRRFGWAGSDATWRTDTARAAVTA